MLNKFRNNDKGFTLVELMMVIVILGVLAGVAIPMVGRLRKDALLAKYESYASTIGSTLIALDMTGDFDWPGEAIVPEGGWKEWLGEYVNIQDDNVDVKVLETLPDTTENGDTIVITLPDDNQFKVAVYLDGKPTTVTKTFTLNK